MKQLKPFLTILILILKSHCFSQIIGTPEYYIFYRGYDNKIEAAALKHVKKIRLESPDIMFTENNERYEHQYIARTKSDKDSSKVYMLNDKNGDTIDVFNVIIRDLPDPDLFFGGCEEGGKASRNETRIFAKYGPNIMFNVSFQVIDGTLILANGRSLPFTGNKINETCSTGLLISPVNSEFTVIARVKGPDGLERTIKATYKL